MHAMKKLRQEAKFELRPEGGVGVSLVVNGEVQCGYRNGLYSRFWSSGMLSVVKGDTRPAPLERSVSKRLSKPCGDLWALLQR